MLLMTLNSHGRCHVRLSGASLPSLYASIACADSPQSASAAIIDTGLPQLYNTCPLQANTQQGANQIQPGVFKTTPGRPAIDWFREGRGTSYFLETINSLPTPSSSFPVFSNRASGHFLSPEPHFSMQIKQKARA